jgi:hypothetical protein
MKSCLRRLSATVACTSTPVNEVSMGVATTSRVPSAVVPTKTIVPANTSDRALPLSTSAADTYGKACLAPR